MDPDAVCDVNMSAVTPEGHTLYTFAKTAQYPPMRCTQFAADGACLHDEYVARYCNLNQYTFNLCIKTIMAILTYINVLPIPWRTAILVSPPAQMYSL